MSDKSIEKLIKLTSFHNQPSIDSKVVYTVKGSFVGKDDYAKNIAIKN